MIQYNFVNAFISHPIQAPPINSLLSDKCSDSFHSEIRELQDAIEPSTRHNCIRARRDCSEFLPSLESNHWPLSFHENKQKNISNKLFFKFYIM